MIDKMLYELQVCSLALQYGQESEADRRLNKAQAIAEHLWVSPAIFDRFAKRYLVDSDIVALAA